jgi:hypothetical protein
MAKLPEGYTFAAQPPEEEQVEETVVQEEQPVAEEESSVLPEGYSFAAQPGDPVVSSLEKPVPAEVTTESILEETLPEPETTGPRSRKEMEQDEELIADIKQHMKDRYNVDADEKLPDFFTGYLFGGDEVTNENILENYMDRWRMITGNSMDAGFELSYLSDLKDREAELRKSNKPNDIEEANKLADQRARALRVYQRADEMAGLFGSKRYEGMDGLEVAGEIAETVGVNVLAAVSDPINVLSVGVGKMIGLGASASGVGLKQAIMKAAAGGAAIEAVASAGTDIVVQKMEIEMGARDEVDYKRTATVATIAGTTGGVLSGVATRNAATRVEKATRGGLTKALKKQRAKQVKLAEETNKKLKVESGSIRSRLAKEIEKTYGKEAVIRNKDGTVKAINSEFIRKSDEANKAFEGVDIDPDLIQPSLSMQTFERVTASTAELFEKIKTGDIKLVNENGNPFSKQMQEKFSSKLQPDEMVSERLLNIVSHISDDTMEVMTDIMGKYGITQREVAAAMFADASIAGKKLNQLSQLSRVMGRAGRIRTAGEAAEANDAKMADKLGTTFRKLEDIRRLTLVSGVATAARNNISQVLRSGVDTLVYGFESAINPNKKFGLRNTLAQLENTFFYQQDAATMAQFMLDLAPAQKQRFYNQYTEVTNAFAKKNPAQASMARQGDGLVSENPILDKWESVITSFNYLNRLQEAVYRNGAFTTSIQRQLFDKGIDMMDVLRNGTITENIPEDMIAKAVDDALEFTYASQPKTELFRQANNFIVKSGLTLAIPFPRFMFKALEMTYNYNATGAATALFRIGAQKAKGGAITDGMYRQLAEGVAGGVPLIALGYTLRDPENGMAGSEWYMMQDGKGNEFDARPYFPLTPYLLIGEIIHRIVEDRPVPKVFNTRELIEGFTGTNFRGAGPISKITEDFLNAAEGGGDLDFKFSVAQLGEYLGEAASGYGQPFYQIGDFTDQNQRKKDYKEDPEFENALDAFTEGFFRPFKSRIGRIFESHSDYNSDLPDLEDPRFKDPQNRVMPFMKLLFGATFSRVPPKYVIELNRMGFTYRDFMTNTDTPSFNRYMNREMGEAMNREMEEVLATARQQYGDDEKAVAAEVRAYISERKAGLYAEMQDRDDTTGLAALRNKFKRQSPYARKYAMKAFKDSYGRSPAETDDPKQNLEDLYELNKLAASPRTMAKQIK